MGYSTKWVLDNLGITRDTLKYYEKKKLISARQNRNPVNNYRDYNEEDIERIWGIKLLTGIGFTTDEVYALMNDPKFDFDTAIARKVSELEARHDQDVIYLEFAKSIKLTGRIPTVSRVGSMRFDDFLAYARKNWNIYDDPRAAPFMKANDLLISKAPQEWSADEVERILQLVENLDVESMTYIFTLYGYFRVLADMRDMGYASDTVQRVVRLLHEYLVSSNTEVELEGKLTSQFVARQLAPAFILGDVSKQNEIHYGKEGCLFIAQALAHYGGYTLDEL